MSIFSFQIIVNNYRKLAIAKNDDQREECLSVINSGTYLDACDWLSQQKARHGLTYSLNQLKDIRVVFSEDRKFLGLIQKIVDAVSEASPELRAFEAVSEETPKRQESTTGPDSSSFSPIRAAFLIGILEQNNYFAINDDGKILAGRGITKQEELKEATKKIFPDYDLQIKGKPYAIKGFWGDFRLYQHAHFRTGERPYCKNKLVINSNTTSYFEWASGQIKILKESETNPRKVLALEHASLTACEEKIAAAENLQKLQDSKT